MTPGPLSWSAQIAAHAAYLDAHRVAVAPPPAPRSDNGRRRSTDNAMQNRGFILTALKDRKPHRFADLQAALPGLTRNGIYYLVAALEEEGLIARTRHERGQRSYQLTDKGASYVH